MIAYSQYEFDNRVHRYSESLVRLGHQTDVICLGQKGQNKFQVLNHVRLFRIQSRNYYEHGPLTYLIRLIQFFILSFYYSTLLYLRNRYDVYHFHNIPDFGIFCTLIPKILGAKVIFDIHDLVPEFYQRKFNIHENNYIIQLLKLIEKIAVWYSDHVITVTSIWKETLIRRSVSENKCTVILNSPDPVLFHPITHRYKKSNNKFNLIYHGNLSEIFGVDLVIHALKIVKKKIPNIHLSIYGQGKDRAVLRKLINELHLENEITLHRPVNRFQVPEIILNSDLGIDPKRDGILAGEGLSSKCMEYLSMNIPVIVSKTKAASTYYDNSMVMFFTPGDSNDLADKIITLYQNPDRRRSLVNNAKKFNQRHRWDNYLYCYEKLLNQLVGVEDS